MVDLNWYILLAAVVLDFIFGDPACLPHPVIYMGKAISFFEPRFRKRLKSPLISGAGFALFLIASTWLISFAAIKLADAVHPVVGDMTRVSLLFFCFSAKSLKTAALAVYSALKENNIALARQKVGMIVGRQTNDLDQAAINRAAVETVAENFVDGFLSPLFFACLGGVPFALAYKMINTLDSMVGYKNDTYWLFGRTAARMDDAANFIPARLSVLIISLCAVWMSVQNGLKSLKTGIFQGHLHKSPNAGYPEAAYAGALGVRLGGPSVYHGRRIEKPFIGKNFDDPEKETIKQACDLMMLSSAASALIACCVLFWS